MVRPIQTWERVTAAVGIVVFLGFAFGCMSLQLGGRNEVISTDPSVASQSGRVTIAAGDVVEVHYPVPYAYPPNLQLEEEWRHCRIVEQRPDSFRVKNLGNSACEVAWKTRGVKVAPVGTLPAGTQETTTSAPTLGAPAIATKQ
jgi:hypothetical protein